VTRRDAIEPVVESAAEIGPSSQTEDRRRLPYAAPKVVDLGDLRSVVLGASVGQPDTGNPNQGFNA
jgi:hypothetical protein